MEDKARLLSPGALPGDGTPNRRLGFVIVGLGRAGQFHLTSMRAVSDRAVLRWVIDIDEDVARSVSQREECRWSTRFDDAMEDPLVEAVVIASATNSHYAYCKAALSAGKVPALTRCLLLIPGTERSLK